MPNTQRRCRGCLCKKIAHSRSHNVHMTVTHARTNAERRLCEPIAERVWFRSRLQTSLAIKTVCCNVANNKPALLHSGRSGLLSAPSHLHFLTGISCTQRNMLPEESYESTDNRSVFFFYCVVGCAYLSISTAITCLGF